MKTLTAICFSIIVISQVCAQDTKPSFGDLYISNAPGLILADKSTSEVNKPTTGRAFALSLVNLGQGGAVEVTPYWWFNRPNLTYEKYIQKKFMFLQTLNLSVANYKSDNTFTLAPGIRAEILRAYSKNSTAAILAKYKELQRTIALLDLKKIPTVKKELDSLSMKGQVAIDVAAAILGTSAGSPFKDLDFNKSGLWANVSWAPAGFPLGFVGLARYSWNDNKAAITNSVSKYFDFGAQTNYTTARFALTAEYVNRRNFLAAQNYSKLTATLSYIITENIQLVGSYGKDLKPGENMIALFGLNFGLERSK